MRAFIIFAVVLFAACGNSSPGDEEEVSGTGRARPPVVAGMFYPADPVELSSMVERLIEASVVRSTGGTIIAGVVPHAGYVYSGATAADFFSLINGLEFDVVILIGPSHRAAFQGMSIFDGDFYLTPLGSVPVAADVADRLRESHPAASFIPAAHEEEHSLEVQIPFLQRSIEPGFRIVPIVTGYTGANELQYMAELILAEAYNEKILVLASSDLSHFPAESLARVVDSLTVEAILSGDMNQFLQVTSEEKLPAGLDTFACGRLPIALVMAYTGLYPGVTSELLSSTTSASVSGDYSRVVGYASIAFESLEPEPSEWSISEEGREELLEIAIASVEAAVENTGFNLPDDTSLELLIPRGAFVTLKRNGRLRGCIGSMRPIRPVAETVLLMARSAAMEDPRFMPVTPGELPDLEYEISVLTPLQILEDWHDVRVGTDGLMISARNRSGVLLPQVPVEQGWNREEFLEGVCLKAGLSPDAYLGEVTLYRFQAQVFGEDEEYSED
ncbi:MAG: AmmeMemoRadiSam system protein B [Candidatus Aegiribacteria sp.]|nr:AmmeMemoRadiSam system protein B [Candidatus Aegiribacteria sp.]